MSIKNWNAGIIRPVPVAPAGPYQDGAAPGVWTLDQAAYWTKQGLWPIAGSGATPVALFGGGRYGSSTFSTRIDKIVIASTGNAITFGSLSAGGATPGVSSSTRAVFFNYTALAYTTFATGGAASTFGNLTSAYQYTGGASNDVRGIFAGGYNTNTQVITSQIQYITIATTGNATNFGNLPAAQYDRSGCASNTRALFAGGRGTSGTPVYYYNIEYVTIATTGDSINFGNLSTNRFQVASLASSTRAVFSGGRNSTGTSQNVIDYVTIASTGNALDFGDLAASTTAPAGTSSSTRGVIGGGSLAGSGTQTNTISYVTISTLGNATYFGDLTQARELLGACSNAHGGL